MAWPVNQLDTVPIDLGPFEDASPCRVLFLRRHVLFGGATGAGKEQRSQPPHGQPGRMPRRGHLGHRSQEGHGAWPVGTVHRPSRRHARRSSPSSGRPVKVLESRAALLAEHGQRVWQPTPEMPALVIIIDEYGELSDDAPDAIKHADSIARITDQHLAAFVASLEGDDAARSLQRSQPRGAMVTSPKVIGTTAELTGL
jgi:hypothetical protein